MADLDGPVPDNSTLCRRQKTLAVRIPYRRADRPLNLFEDSTGIKFLDDGEWLARKHGAKDRCQWRKVHLAMDAATSDIRAAEIIFNHGGDRPVLPELFDQIPKDEEIGNVPADGPYDTRRCHIAIIARQASAIIPIQKNGWPWKEGCSAVRPPIKTCKPRGTTAGLSGSGRPAITSEVVSRRKCAASNHSESGSPHGTQIARPPKSTSASL